MKYLKMSSLVGLGLAAALSSAAWANPADAVSCESQAFLQVLQPSAALPPGKNAVWLNAQELRWPDAKAHGNFRLVGSRIGQLSAVIGERVRGADFAAQLENLGVRESDKTPPTQHVGAGVQLRLSKADQSKLSKALQGQLLLVREDTKGRVLEVAHTQHALALDALYADFASKSRLGASVLPAYTEFQLWAPTAQKVQLCIHPSADAVALRVHQMQRSVVGNWVAGLPGNLHGQYYTYLVDVFAPGTGLIRHRVTDPYADSLNANSQRAMVTDWSAKDIAPAGWGKPHAAGARVKHSTDMVMYELHVRDFSLIDQSVPEKDRGKYLAFTHLNSAGMRQMKKLADAGITDIHLLPVFDIATVPEVGCISPRVPQAAPDSEAQQAAVMKDAGKDCFNWGYDPLHFGAVEGSYASDANDGKKRISEFRAMVQALHNVGLRVGMDLVYNHTSSHGLAAQSILDRIVPGYYQRLNAHGQVEMSTCCSNTATEHAMMEKLMTDTVVRLVKQYAIDSFRFDLMGHQPRAAMERVQTAANAAVGRHVPMIGEGWNFGEIANGSRFVQASQMSLNGSGIATFSDRMRDALRGGAFNDNAQQLVSRQGFLNGLYVAPNGSSGNSATAQDLSRVNDMVKLGLAGSVRNYVLTTNDGSTKTLAQMKYGDDPAGYVAEPTEVVNYADNHDNQTLFDINVYKLPPNTSREDRARAQMLGVAVVALSQGVAYYHAGTEVLRSKSLDRNSYDSGDWFNRIDWTMQDNFFAAGLPSKQDNGDVWATMKPFLNNPLIKPLPENIRWMNEVFTEWLSIRSSTRLLRMDRATDIAQRLKFHNTGPAQNPAVIVASIDGSGYPGANFKRLAYAINTDTKVSELSVPELANTAWQLHPAQRSGKTADLRLKEAQIGAQGQLRVPARSAVVWVLE
jgi:pullulanase/glycogen debranching enzyme